MGPNHGGARGSRGMKAVEGLLLWSIGLRLIEVSVVCRRVSFWFYDMLCHDL